MIGGDHQTFQQVVDAMERWIPEKKYRRETKFRDDLQDYLDAQLNSGGGGVLGGGMSQQDHVVSVEHGKVNADVCVNDQIGIELKRDQDFNLLKFVQPAPDQHIDSGIAATQPEFLH